VLHSLVVGLGSRDIAEERHLTCPRRRSAERVALDDLLTEQHVVELGVNWWVEGSKVALHRLDAAQGPSALTVDLLALDVPETDRDERRERILLDATDLSGQLLVEPLDVAGEGVAVCDVLDPRQHGVRSGEDDLSGGVEPDRLRLIRTRLVVLHADHCDEADDVTLTFSQDGISGRR
jgi:hypothetical protein